jgi:hypothetical protein
MSAGVLLLPGPEVCPLSSMHPVMLLSPCRHIMFSPRKKDNMERSQAENLSNTCLGPPYSIFNFAKSRSWFEFPASVNTQQLNSLATEE